MTGEASQLINLKWKPAGFVTYGDNNRGKILGVGVELNFQNFSQI